MLSQALTALFLLQSRPAGHRSLRRRLAALPPRTGTRALLTDLAVAAAVCW
jgi:hypothetical protein